MTDYQNDRDTHRQNEPARYHNQTDDANTTTDTTDNDNDNDTNSSTTSNDLDHVIDMPGTPRPTCMEHRIDFGELGEELSEDEPSSAEAPQPQRAPSGLRLAFAKASEWLDHWFDKL